MAEKILTLVTKPTTKGLGKKKTTLLKTLLNTILCRKRTTSENSSTLGKQTPVKRAQPQNPTPLLFPQKKARLEFNNVVDLVQDALTAFNAF